MEIPGFTHFCRRMLACLLVSFTPATAGSARWDFTNDTAQSNSTTVKTSPVTTHDFGTGVTVSALTLTPGSGGTGSITETHGLTGNKHGYLSFRQETTKPTVAITLAIDNTVSVNLTGLSFTYGAYTNATGQYNTPSFSLASSLGGITAGSTGSVVLNSLNTPVTSTFNATLGSPLQNLTNTTVTFTWTLDTSVALNSANADRGHLIDNIVLTGSVTNTPPPPAPPVISAFQATPSTVIAGGTTTLSWQVQNATTLSIDQGVGEVTPLTSGSKTAKVPATTTYTLTATNAAGTATATTTASVRQPPAKPNILLVLVDDMGTEDTSVNFNYRADGTVLAPIDPTSVGLAAFSQTNGHFRTPAMEALAANGMRFSRAYACQVCSPTRCSILTGQNSARHGTHQYISGGGSQFNVKAPPNPGLKAANRTLAEVMRDAGYRTIVAGKGHIGSDFNANAGNYVTPASPANDYYGFQVNVSASTNGQQGDCYANATTAFGLSASGTTASFVTEYQNKTYNQIDPVAYPAGSPFATEPVFVTEALTREMNERIEQSVNEGLPFFAYFSHFAVHAPHQTDPRFAANYPGLTGDVLAFATMIEGMDKSLGDVIAKLDELGIAENTLVVFLGDNGSDSKPRGGEPNTLTMSNPLRGEKGMRYEGGVRVPMMISWAKRNAANSFQQSLPIVAGGRTHDIVTAYDLFPTVLAAAGVARPSVDDSGAPLVLDGADLTPYLKAVPNYHRPQRLITHAPNDSRSVFFTTLHDQNWKLVYNYTTSVTSASLNVPLGTYELYDLATDPFEAVNLADPATPGYNPNRVMSMARTMVGELQSLGAPMPILIASDSDLASIGLPSTANAIHPVVLPAITGVDGDDDGLDDNLEDPNRNGIRDTTETAADASDTDGDTTPDGPEVRLGLDPLNPGQWFRLHCAPPANGNLTLTWPSKPGTRFEVRASTDLNQWNEIIAADLAADSGQSTSLVVPSSQEQKRFFRVMLKP